MASVSRESYAAAVERLDGSSTGRPSGAAGRHRRRDPRGRATCSSVSPGCAGRCPTRPGPATTGPTCSVRCSTGKVSADAATCCARWSPAAGRRPASCSTRPSGSASRRCWPARTSAGELAEVEDELFRFGQIVDGDYALAAALGTSTAPVAQRAGWPHSLLEGKAKPATVRLVDVALHGFGGRNFAGSLTRLVELAAERRDRQIAYVTVAGPSRRGRGAGWPPGWPRCTAARSTSRSPWTRRSSVA